MHCSFTGEALIDWLIKWGFSEDRGKALALATDLVAAAHIQPQAKSREVAGSGKLVADDSRALYKFVSQFCKGVGACLIEKDRGLKGGLHVTFVYFCIGRNFLTNA